MIRYIYISAYIYICSRESSAPPLLHTSFPPWQDHGQMNLSFYGHFQQLPQQMTLTLFLPIIGNVTTCKLLHDVLSSNSPFCHFFSSSLSSFSFIPSLTVNYLSSCITAWKVSLVYVKKYIRCYFIIFNELTDHSTWGMIVGLDLILHCYPECGCFLNLKPEHSGGPLVSK